MLKTQLKFIITIALALGLSISFQSLLAVWSPPDVNPPGNNIDKPINISIIPQTKSGTLKLSTDLEVSRDLTVINQVGIGIFNTSATGPNLYIKDTMANFFLDSTDNNSASFISLLHNGTKQWSIGENPFWSLGSNDFYIYGQTAGKGLFIKKDTGNIGIGENNPTSQLFIRTGNPVALEVQSTDTFARVHFEGANGTIISAAKTDTSKKLNLQSTGMGSTGAFIGLYGQTYPSTSRGGVVISSATAGTEGYISMQTRGSSRLFIDNSGDVGVGTTNPSAGLKLDVEGRIGATEYCDKDGESCTAAADIGGGGGAHVTCVVTGWVNDMDHGVGIDCGEGYLAGTTSYHDDHYEDRRFRYKCCFPAGTDSSTMVTCEGSDNGICTPVGW